MLLITKLTTSPALADGFDKLPACLLHQFSQPRERFASQIDEINVVHTISQFANDTSQVIRYVYGICILEQKFGQWAGLGVCGRAWSPSYSIQLKIVCN